MNREDAIRAATEDTDWSGAEVETTTRKGTMVYSTRLPDDLSRWLEDEADRCGINPSAMIRELVADAPQGSQRGQDNYLPAIRVAPGHQPNRGPRRLKPAGTYVGRASRSTTPALYLDDWGIGIVGGPR